MSNDDMDSVDNLGESPPGPANAGIEDSLSRWNTLMHEVAAGGDRAAFRQLFEHFAPLIKAFACKANQSSQGDAMADELVQETMLKVWTRAESFNADMASASTWIFTIARNTRIDLLRKNARHTTNVVSTDDEDSPLDKLATDELWADNADTDVFNLLARQHSRRQIHESLKALPVEQACILEKVYMEDKSHSEVAAELDLPLGTVKSRVRLALKKLQLTVDR